MKTLIVLPWLAIIFFENTFAADTLKPKQTLVDDGHSLVSIGGRFEFGFFSLGRSENRYLGIRYKSGAPELRVVWIANREDPIKDASGVLKITESGNILLFRKESSSPIWFSNSSMTDPILQLLSTGNLVVKSASSENYAWQSIDHPQDTQIAGMKLGKNLKTGHVWRLSSWASLDDPSPGEFTIELEPRLPQLIQRQRGSGIFYRSPPWNGAQFGRDPASQTNFRMVLVYDETEVYYTFETVDATVMRFWMSPNGTMTLFRWADGSRNYSGSCSYSMVSDECDSFARCGPNGICRVDRSRITYYCSCPAGFMPRAPPDWAGRDWSGGCVLKGDQFDSRFVKLSGLKLPYSSEFSANKKVTNVTECELVCRGNRSCVAYTVAAVGGCVVWFGDLLDIRVYNDSRGQDLYLRVADNSVVIGRGGNQIMRAVIISISVLSGFLVIFCVYITRKRTIYFFVCLVKIIKSSRKTPIILEEDVEPRSFGFDSISNATNNFCPTNIIGQGGFGPVYKGTLPSGQQIAVKRLSQDSGQGLEEFKNEVLLIVKLQHQNLVRLLGHCIHREERMLIYEYMPNKSLDLYIFKQTKDTALNWQRRYDIIVGISRGLLYLHRDSRLRIIHRDLKAGNILLDSEMNPKISDFGLAKVLGGEKSDSNTKRIFGTYGYMSPEYAIDGNFSVKSDVFSFGVMVLEMVSGKRNRGFEHPDHDLNLLGHAWILWNEGRAMELIEDLMAKNNQTGAKILRCIQMGLLCVQKRPEERPLMSYVDSMLDSNCSLPQPKEPGFFFERVPGETHPHSSLVKSYTNAQTSITQLCGR